MHVPETKNLQLTKKRVFLKVCFEYGIYFDFYSIYVYFK